MQHAANAIGNNWRAGDMPKITRALVAGYVVLAFILSASAFYGFFAVRGEGLEAETFRAASSNPYYKLMWLLLYGSTCVALLYAIVRDGIQASLITAIPIVALVLISASWSPNPGTSLFYGTMLTANILIGYSLSQLLTPGNFLRILLRILIVCLLITHVMIHTHPDMVANTRWGGGWLTGNELNGIFAHKTDAGLYFASLALVITCWPGTGLSNILRVVIGALAILTVGLTNSATALSVLILLIPFGIFLRRVRKPGMFLAAGALVIVLFAVTVPFINLGNAVTIVGRDAQLTGRSSIWGAAPEFIEKRPVLGYGYAGFFDSGEMAPAQEIWRRRESMWFKTPHFHNSGLDVITAIGFTGLAFYLMVIAGALSVAANRTIDQPTRYILALLLLLFVLGSAFDFNLMKHNNFPTMFLFYCLFAAQRNYGGTQSVAVAGARGAAG
jgi:O-antigen ligase